jgi:imidazolonepropionase
MASQIFTNISLLVNTRSENKLLRGKEFADLPCIKNAYIIIEDDHIAGYGEMNNFKYHETKPSRQPDNCMVLPCWCDSHTHIVFAGSRENEFVNKIKGLSYTDIAKNGGGILMSAKSLNETSENELFRQSWARLEEVKKLGTGAIEIKSGYGLSLDGELKMLRVIKKLKDKSEITIKATFLAHTFPEQYKNDHEKYIQLLIREMLPLIAAEKLADYIDVFCEKSFFSPDEMETICNAGRKYGLQPKLHVNQLNSVGGIEKALSLNALSLDHLETLTLEEINLLGSFKGCSTLLPTAAFFLGMNYPPLRSLINIGAAVTLASDYNPGSSPSGNMNFVVSLACIGMKMLPEEAINAATINGAFAMGVENDYGSITVGKKANLIFTKQVSSLAFLPYSFGNDLISKVMIKGSFI